MRRKGQRRHIRCNLWRCVVSHQKLATVGAEDVITKALLLPKLLTKRYSLLSFCDFHSSLYGKWFWLVCRGIQRAVEDDNEGAVLLPAMSAGTERT
jgi:hypothetical protein